MVTGAGRGSGRAHAPMLALHGAIVVVNDMGGSAAGIGDDQTPAQEVVETIRSTGGEAVVDTSDVSDWKGSKAMIGKGIENFGGLEHSGEQRWQHGPMTQASKNPAELGASIEECIRFSRKTWALTAIPGWLSETGA